MTSLGVRVIPQGSRVGKARTNETGGLLSDKDSFLSAVGGPLALGAAL